ncbi:MFS family permease [Novosphingobium sp. SG751A]|uniref:MFS transporter n=1 Tax=Novosphingobium sp. SG751A TaxID=2587000 RepID=UPI0020A6D44D|nr:MFS transporter [Novosphingobium sp. SG751A]NOW48059.1 MFS family permease [Novosphingobium sp. SG751A]
MSAQFTMTADPGEGDRIFRKVSLRLAPLLMVCYLLNYIDRSNIGFAKLAFTRDLGMSEAAYGLGAGLFYIGYSLCEIPSNMLLRRIGARLTLLRIMIGWGLCATLFAFMQTAAHYYILRILLGIAEAGFFPGVLLFISYWIPGPRRARFTAMFMSAMALSGVIGGPISGLILTHMDGIGGLKGWQWMFIIEGLPSALMGVVTYFMLADRPADAKWLSAHEKAVWQAEFARKDARSSAMQHASFGAALKDLRFWSMAAMAISLFAGAAGVQLWLPTILRGAGISSIGMIGLISAGPFALAVVVQQWVARRSDRFGERRWHAALPCLISTLGWLALILVDHNWVLSVVALTIVVAGIMGGTGPFWAMPSRYLTGSAAAGGLALIAMSGGLGSFISPTIVGWLTTMLGSLKFGFLYYAALMALGPTIMLWGTAKIEQGALRAGE